MAEQHLIIAVDGHSSCGKSTFAKAIAEKLYILYIDSGAMYRAVTLACLEQNLIKAGKTDEKEIAKMLGELQISIVTQDGSSKTFLNGVNVEEKIRSIEVSNNVSIVSKSARVRNKMVTLQREMGQNRSLVMDGRDIGTTVFPEAKIKIFMTAEPGIRAERRFRELTGKGMDVTYEEILANVTERDEIDENRKESPLIKAPDAIVLDNSFMTPGEQMEWFTKLLAELKIN